MPGATTDQGIVIPIGTDVADNPDAFVDMLAGVESRLVKRYASRAARSANNPAPSTGEISEIAGETWLERYTGAKWLPVTPIQVFKTADQIVNNSTALVNDTHLAAPIPAVVANWAIEGWLYYASGATPDIKFASAADAAISSVGFSVQAISTSGATAGNDNGNWDAIDAVATALPIGGVGAAASVSGILSGHLISTGTAGTLQLQWAQNSLDASDTTLFEGCWLRLTAIS